MIYNDLALFTAVAQNLGFSAAATQLGIPLSRVSRRISELEDHLGVKLFERTTRQVRLTEEGRRLLDRCQEPVEALQEISGMQDDTRIHTIRITAPAVAARTTVGPRILEFAAQNPDVKIDLSSTNAHLDFFRDNIDLAFRVGPLTDSNLVARKLWTMRYGFYIGKSLAQKLEIAETLSTAELAKLPALQSRQQWLLADGTLIKPKDVRHELDELELLSSAVEMNMGVAMLPRDLKTETMQEIKLPDTAPIERDMFAVYPSKRLLPTRIRALIQFLAEGASR